jgi:SNF2 family DNA or RNA helicase
MARLRAVPFRRHTGLTGTPADHFLRRQLIELRLTQSFEDLRCLRSLQGVDIYVHRRDTVRKVLRHFKGRALLADETGLGKTIEACLVLKEYWLRGLVRKAPVLAPPSLINGRENRSKNSACSPSRRVPPRPAPVLEAEPLVMASVAIATLDLYAAAIAAVPWDMVIVDEAHCLKNRASANWQLVDSLQERFILMLTATPVENNLIGLYILITLLKPGLLATEAEFRKTHVTPGSHTRQQAPCNCAPCSVR